jgi:23S rRNA pseudouridine2605 synthase
MTTDKENWQEKPGEGGNSARRDGERNSGNLNSKPWSKPGENKGSGNSFDRPRRSFGDNPGDSNRGGNSFDKPRRSFVDKGNSFDRPNRSFGERNNNDRPSRPYGEGGGNSFDKPRRSFGDQGNSFDHPRRSFGEGAGNDRPQRPFNSGGNRFGSSNSFDRPRRTFGEGESNDRPRRSFSGDSGNRFGGDQGGNRFGGNQGGNSFDKPRRSFGEGDSSDRPRRNWEEGGNNVGGGNSFDRPRRSYGDNNDRPSRGYGESSDRPRRSYGDEGGFKPRFNSGPSLPKPDRNDGRPRRPRIKKENSFDHGTPYGNRPSAPQYPVAMDPNTPIRLNKFLANAGICSRREADEFIQAGVVRVNGEVVSELGVKVKPIDTILFHDQPVSIEHKIYILLNKPKDCVTTSDDPQERLTVMDLVKGACYERIYPVGRLDRNTTGVLLLTNDGDLASKLTHPKYEKRKIYQVTLDKDISVEDIQHILDGVTLDDCEVKADNCSHVDPDKKSVVGIEIHSGQNRVVRRVFESLGYKVHKLDRVYFAGLTKKNLPRGKWRHLSEKEVSLLKMGAFV